MATGLSRSKALWFGVLTGPLLWFAQLNVNYQWEEVLACSPSNTEHGSVLGMPVKAWIVLVNSVAVAGTLLALAVAVRCWRRTAVVTAGALRTVEHRRDVAHWMALAGMANSALFLLLIVVGYAPAIILKQCQAPL
jgi:hypothetical protein